MARLRPDGSQRCRYNHEGASPAEVHTALICPGSQLIDSERECWRTTIGRSADGSHGMDALTRIVVLQIGKEYDQMRTQGAQSRTVDERIF